MSANEIFKRINSMRSDMSKSQLKIANYILENPHSLPFLTGKKLAQTVAVSEATVVRFASFLGYKGYNDLQDALIKTAERQLNTVERLQMSRKVYNETEKTVYDIFQDDINNIHATIQGLNIEDFKQGADYILEAKRIYIVANRSAVALGSFLQYYLDLILGNSDLIHTTASAFDRIFDINEEDLVIGISFARYTKSTIDITSYAHEKGAKILAITDQLNSPITAYADLSLFAKSQMPTFIDSFTAPISLINALIAYIGQRKHVNINKRLEQLEELWDRYHVFHKD